MNTNNNEIIDRLRKYLKDEKLTYRDFTKILGLSFANLSNYLTYKYDIQKIFILLHLKAGINLEWLITGKGKPESDKFSTSKRLGRAIDYTRTEILNAMKSELSHILQFEEPTFEEIKLMNEAEYKVCQYKLTLKAQLDKFINVLEIEIPQKIEFGYFKYPEEVYESYLKVGENDDDVNPHYFLEKATEEAHRIEQLNDYEDYEED